MVESVCHLLSLPSVYTRLEKTLKDPFHTREDIARIISSDPSLAARVLRIVNSSFYSLPKSVQNISTAVNLIGEYDLKNLVLVTSVVNSVNVLVDKGIDMQEFWKHSISCGITARLLAKKQQLEDSEFLFLSGLLHDLGHLILYYKEPELFNTVSRQVKNEGKERYLVEIELLGFDHALVGAYLMETWGLPEKLEQLIQYHHQYELASQFKDECRLINLADQLSHLLEENGYVIELDALPATLSDLGMEQEELGSLLTTVLEQTSVIEEMICNT